MTPRQQQLQKRMLNFFEVFWGWLLRMPYSSNLRVISHGFSFPLRWHLSALESHQSWSVSSLEMDGKVEPIHLLRTREDLIIMLSFLRMSLEKLPFYTPHHLPKWALRGKSCSHPQMMMFITMQISACYLLNQWMPIWPLLIESLSHRSHLETVHHRSDLMSLYCQRCVWMSSGATQAAGCLATKWY